MQRLNIPRLLRLRKGYGAQFTPRVSRRFENVAAVSVFSQRLTQTRQYHFASPEYESCFSCEPPVDMGSVRQETIQYLENFDPELWHQDPVRTIVAGKEFKDGEVVDTPDAFGTIVGKQILNGTQTVNHVIEHMQTFRPPMDLRDPVRRIEQRLLYEHAAKLVGNQALDFHKQDGITEMEESIFANKVEREMNDMLFADEIDMKVRISRDPALVGCVSNFSNFLDLFRKTLRNIELGVPVVILSRSNTTQHMFRWTQLLLDELKLEGVDLGMVTYLSCSLKEQRRVMKAFPNSPLYFTGSREVAAAIKEILPKTFASTGGPNTMVAAEMNPNIEDAIRMSCLIENSGQCTAMRHLVAPQLTEQQVDKIFNKDNMEHIDVALDSLKESKFSAIFNKWNESFTPDSGYQKNETNSVAFRVGDEFPVNIEENWRRVYLDVTASASEEELRNPEYLSKLAKWLVHEQPITLSVNGDSRKQGFPIASALFEQTAQVVYSVGVEGGPSLTCQARPQDGEVFGEFPPRRELLKHTKFPVVVPSSTPGYNTTYTQAHLENASKTDDNNLLRLSESPEAKGYNNLLAAYLKQSCGPKINICGRSVLWGLQRPPLGQPNSLLRIDKDSTVDMVGRYIIPFYMTNAKEQLDVSVDPDVSYSVITALDASNVQYSLETEDTFNTSARTKEAWNVIYPDKEFDYPLVGHFVSTLFPLGHIKSVDANDQEFLNHFSKSAKWLRID
eukprot:m.62062 g.62062  ORF g.62062 m.62062 type:complete len:731 (+) comp11478_c1_seq1:293-2485(+)